MGVGQRPLRQLHDDFCCFLGGRRFFRYFLILFSKAALHASFAYGMILYIFTYK